jgi:hypothetical protein
MFASLISLLDEFAVAFDADALDGNDAARVVSDLGLARRLLDGMLAKAIARVDDTKAYGSARDAAHFYA